MYNRKENEELFPKFLCKSCTKCVDKRCTFYNRPVEKTFNRCFNHSNYHTVATRYQSPEQIETIAEDNYLKEIA